MAIRSSPFGGTVLTGEDAVAFNRQIEDEDASFEAKQSLKRGLVLVDMCEARSAAEERKLRKGREAYERYYR